MVGIPTSKGCGTCRRRKIACSQERPVCSQCIKSRRTCEGYHRPLKVVMSEPSTGKGLKGRKMISSSPKPCKPTLEVSCETFLPKAVPSGQSVYRQQIFGLFLDRLFPTGSFRLESNKSWMFVLADIPSPSPVLESSILALSATNLGRLHGDSQLVVESQRIYIQALQRLHKALSDPELVLEDQTLASTIVLLLYEAYESPETALKSWLSHQEGCRRLLEIRGAGAHRQRLGHEVFRSIRYDIALQAICMGRSTNMTSTDWMTVPWEGYTKPVVDQVIDVLLVAAGLFHQRRTLDDLSASKAVSKALSLLGRCMDLDEQLMSISPNLDKDDVDFQLIYWTDGQERIEFANLDAAAELTAYWSAVAILWKEICYLHGFVSMFVQDDDSNAGAMTQLPPLEHRSDFIKIARRVLQSVDYCLRPEMLGIGPILASRPLRLVAMVFQGEEMCEAEAKWTADAFSRLQSRLLPTE